MEKYKFMLYFMIKKDNLDQEEIILKGVIDFLYFKSDNPNFCPKNKKKPQNNEDCCCIIM